MAQTECLDDGADLPVCVDKLAAPGIEGGNPRSQLATVLQIQEHPGDQPGHLIGASNRGEA